MQLPNNPSRANIPVRALVAVYCIANKWELWHEIG